MTCLLRWRGNPASVCPGAGRQSGWLYQVAVTGEGQQPPLRGSVSTSTSGTEHRQPHGIQSGLGFLQWHSSTLPLLTECSLLAPLLGNQISGELTTPVSQYGWEHKCVSPSSKLRKSGLNQHEQISVGQCNQVEDSPLALGFAQF